MRVFFSLLLQVIVFQTYTNQSHVPIEAKYIFPLDDKAAVCGFEAFINGKHIVGEVRRKGMESLATQTAITLVHPASTDRSSIANRCLMYRPHQTSHSRPPSTAPPTVLSIFVQSLCLGNLNVESYFLLSFFSQIFCCVFICVHMHACT